ncbi:MAG: hypothetical protein ACOX1G_04345 [bacterium]|jgi:hypothetical protein|nr:hypothetical protein [bacterium]
MKMWHKGYTHLHTSFRYPTERRIAPEMLIEELNELDAGFAFCAGDHGDIEGSNYWGIDSREYEEYKEACLSVNEPGGPLLIPAPEAHLMFAPFTERHEHHCCVPIADYLPRLNFPESRALAASYTKEVGSFIAEAHEHNLSLTLNHPHLSVNSLFSGPPPLSLAPLFQMDYLELCTIGSLASLKKNLEIYLGYLSNPASAVMGCCAGVDNAESCWRLLSAEARVVPSTYLYIHGKLNRESLMNAWNERRSYMAYGDLSVEMMEPVPSKRYIETMVLPSIKIILFSDEDIILTVYRNGVQIYREKGNGKYGLNWRDEVPLPGRNHYVVHVEAKGKHLVTSPVNYDYAKRQH